MAQIKIRFQIKHLKIEADIDYEGTYDDDVRAGVVAMLTEVITPTVVKTEPFDGEAFVRHEL